MLYTGHDLGAIPTMKRTVYSVAATLVAILLGHVLAPAQHARGRTAIDAVADRAGGERIPGNHVCGSDNEDGCARDEFD